MVFTPSPLHPFTSPVQLDKGKDLIMYEGRVVQVVGPVIDVEFGPEGLPRIDTAVTVVVPDPAGERR
ncbi:MAG: hypothetical protein ACM3ZC_09875, partial [Bacteroidota bacterium]